MSPFFVSCFVRCLFKNLVKTFIDLTTFDIKFLSHTFTVNFLLKWLKDKTRYF